MFTLTEPTYNINEERSFFIYLVVSVNSTDPLLYDQSEMGYIVNLLCLLAETCSNLNSLQRTENRHWTMYFERNTEIVYWCISGVT